MQSQQDRAWEGLAGERQRFEPLIASIEARIKDLKAEAAANCTFVPVAEQVQPDAQPLDLDEADREAYA